MTHAIVQPAVRVKARYLGGTRVEFTCLAGHVWTEDLRLPKGKRYPHMQLSEVAVAMLARHWEVNPYKVTATCKACRTAHPTPLDHLHNAQRRRPPSR